MIHYDEEQFLLSIGEIKQLQLSAETYIIHGKCTSFENYKEMCGRIKAYSECSQIANEFLNKMRNS